MIEPWRARTKIGSSAALLRGVRAAPIFICVETRVFPRGADCGGFGKRTAGGLWGEEQMGVCSALEVFHKLEVSELQRPVNLFFTCLRVASCE